MSATIYQFPEGGRARSAVAPRETSTDTTKPVPAAAPAVTACGAAWYHDAAIEDDERSRTR